MEYLDRMARLCARESGAVALLRRPDEGGAVALLLLCTKKSLHDVEAALPRLAAQAGELLSAVPMRGGLFCHYAEPPQLVQLRCRTAEQYIRCPEDTALWAWRSVLDEAPRRVNGAALLQETEDRVWLLILQAVALAEQGEALEAADCLAELRQDCLLPLLELVNRRYSGSQRYRAGNYAAQLACTHPLGLDAESIKDALEAARQIYFALRYELAGEGFVRREQYEEPATRSLEVAD
ncbi:MAG: hypothetical protein IJC43_08410 [Clostridia bacterium]|nr:hypothetical protein [Clostridia bacterium]